MNDVMKDALGMKDPKEFLECPECKKTNVRAHYVCRPCGDTEDGAPQAATTEWDSQPAPDPDKDGQPARQPCPNCGKEQGAVSCTCTDCWHIWKP